MINDNTILVTSTFHDPLKNRFIVLSVKTIVVSATIVNLIPLPPSLYILLPDCLRTTNDETKETTVDDLSSRNGKLIV
jgi:hypothetical protein